MIERRPGSIIWMRNMTTSVWLRGSNCTSNRSVRPLMLALTPLNVTASVAHKLQLTAVSGPDGEASAGSSEPAGGGGAGVTSWGALHWASSRVSCATPTHGARPDSNNEIG